MAKILQFPSSLALALRVEPERGGEGWLVLTHNREHGFLHGDFRSALRDAQSIAADLGVVVRSSAGAAP
jgi:hypothetical protein